jgi:hypothetical protein
MSIEWLLAKTAGIVTQSNPTKKPHKEDELSCKTCGSKPGERKQTAEDGNEESLHRAEHSSCSNIQNKASEIKFCCRCGYTGALITETTDFKLLRTDNNDLVYLNVQILQTVFQLVHQQINQVPKGL